MLFAVSCGTDDDDEEEEDGGGGGDHDDHDGEDDDGEDDDGEDWGDGGEEDFHGRARDHVHGHDRVHGVRGRGQGDDDAWGAW